jgi:hypothetical protein
VLQLLFLLWQVILPSLQIHVPAQGLLLPPDIEPLGHPN